MKDDFEEKARVIKMNDGTVRHLYGGVLHREDGPAIIKPYGRQEWYINGQLHRDGGPAIVDSNFHVWYKNGERHRTDGPAFIDLYNKQEYWFLNDEPWPEGKALDKAKQKWRERSIEENIALKRDMPPTAPPKFKPRKPSP